MFPIIRDVWPSKVLDSVRKYFFLTNSGKKIMTNLCFHFQFKYTHFALSDKKIRFCFIILLFIYLLFYNVLYTKINTLENDSNFVILFLSSIGTQQLSSITITLLPEWWLTNLYVDKYTVQSTMCCPIIFYLSRRNNIYYRKIDIKFYIQFIWVIM